ncbi:MAG: carbohydrate binding family 9 domain-containing protein [Saprospiraceae bacterium]
MSVKTATLLLISIFYSQLSIGENPERKLRAHRIQENIDIDGFLNEGVWQSAEAATDFIVTEPVPGAIATFKTRVFFLYDDNAVYIGARMYDDNPDKILRELSLRDQIGNADNFRVFFDTYQSGLNGFKFFVTSSGVQLEAIVSNHSDDLNWNAIWESKVNIDNEGWTVEMKIPYSALRFPSGNVQEWNVQFGREIRRLREVSYWSPIDPTISGWVQQSGTVTNIEKIATPVRLSVTPYLSGYVNTYNPRISNQSTFCIDRQSCRT